MKWKQLYPWFLGEMAVFLAVNAGLLLLIHVEDHPLPSFTPWMFALYALAVYRGTHLLANEKITKPLRSPFVECRIEDGKETEHSLTEGWRGAIGCIVSCPSCMGIWVASCLYYALVFTPYVAQAVSVILALSAVERLLTSSVDALRAQVNP